MNQHAHAPLPVYQHPFGPQLARCGVDGCELQHQCAAQKWVGATPPSAGWSGIMLIGEGPGTVELSRRQPFVGPSGRLLNGLLEAAGIDRATTWVTNATLCFPPKAEASEGKTPFHDRFPASIYACLPRLEAEIAACRPRVIVTLGQSALISVAGYEVQGSRRVPQNCTSCSPEDRKIGPVLKCAVGECSWFAPVVDDDHAAQLKVTLNHTCPACRASIKRIKPRRIACPTCGGTKTREEQFTTFAHDHALGEIAGGLLRASSLKSRLDEFGVEWIIPTYHPAFMLRSADSSSGKKFGGQYAARAVVEHLEKARRIAQGNQPRFDLEVELTDRVEDIEAYLAEPGKFTVDIETDSEDEADNGGPFRVSSIKVVGIQRVGQPRALVIDTREVLRGGLDKFGNPHPLAIALYRFFTSTAHRKALQNGFYDRTTIWWFWGMPFVGQVDDTMLAHQVLYPDEPHKLGHIGYCMTDVEAWKPPKKKKGELQFKSFEELCVYNARDLRVTDLADDAMTKPHGRLDVEGVRRVYDVDMRLLDLAVRATQNGMPVDRDAIKAIGDEAYAAIARTLGRYIEGFIVGSTPESVTVRQPDGGELSILASAVHFIEQRNDPAMPGLVRVHSFGDMRRIIAEQLGPERAAAFEASNPGHISWALFDKAGPLRLTPQVFTDKKKEPATSKDALLKVADEPTGFVQALLEWRKYDKIRSTYVEGDGMAAHSDGRMRAQWKVAKAVTGRWSSSPNFQNWPKALRAAIVAPKGRRICGADFAQLELRIMAALSGDPELIRRCANADEKRKLEPDWDPHSYVASLTFGDAFNNLALKDAAHFKAKPGEPKCKCDVCKRVQLRDITKRVIYGLNYGAGAQTVLEAIYDGGYEGPPISISLIEKVTKIVFQAFPGVKKWRDQALATARRTREVRSPLLARRRIFPLGDVESTVAYNYPIQSGAADIMNLRLIALVDALDARFGVNVVMFLAQVHDAVYFECDEAIADEVCSMIESYLSWTVSIAEGAPEMPFVASANAAQTWKDAA